MPDRTSRGSVTPSRAAVISSAASATLSNGTNRSISVPAIHTPCIVKNHDGRTLARPNASANIGSSALKSSSVSLTSNARTAVAFRFRIAIRSLANRHPRDFIADRQRRWDVGTFDDLPEHRVFAVELVARGERDVDLAVAFRRLAHVGQSDGARLVRPPRRHLGRAHRFAAGRGVAESPQVPFADVPALRVTELNDESAQGSVHVLAVVEMIARQGGDVLDGLWRIAGERLDHERALHGLDDEERCRGCSLSGPAEAGLYECERPQPQSDTGQQPEEHSGRHRAAHTAMPVAADREMRVTPICAHIGRTTHSGQRGYTGRQTFCPQVTRYRLISGHQRRSVAW